MYWFAFQVFIYLLYVPFLKNEKSNKNSWLFPGSREQDRCRNVFMGYLFPNICSGVDSKWFDLEAEHKSLQAQVELRFVLNLFWNTSKQVMKNSFPCMKLNITLLGSQWWSRTPGPLCIYHSIHYQLTFDLFLPLLCTFFKVNIFGL